MSRLENSVSSKDLLRLGNFLADQFIASYESEPELIVIDMDPSAHRTYGDQQLTLFNTHVKDYCLMPFYIYEGISGKLISTIIRPGKTPTAREIITIPKRLVARIRAVWKKTVLVFRADSHHTKPKVMDWLEENKVEYITGLSPNSVLKEQFKHCLEQAINKFDRYGIDKNN